MQIEPPPAADIERVVQEALAEDRAEEDVTTLATVEAGVVAVATFVARVPGRLCGVSIAGAAFRALDSSVEVEWALEEGAVFEAGAELAHFRGPVRALLSGERTALNLVQRLSGVATLTAAYVAAVEGTGARILDTRKTTPGLRTLEKYAVRCGGGRNHRNDLASMAMIKDNHRVFLALRERSLAEGVGAIRELAPGVEVEVEVDSVEQLDAALEGKPEWILLDNMSPEEMAQAVNVVGGRCKLEASGGVTLETVRAIAETGVDAISVGALTHSAPALDISMELKRA